MTDQQLKPYLPSYGDRLAVVSFCRRCEGGSGRKARLFDRLRSKLQRRTERGDEEETSSGQNSASKNALKTMRKVELGWMNFDKKMDCFKQVRTKRGGGTRKVTVSKDAEREDLIKEAIKLYFPSILGPITCFDVDLKDYQQMAVNEGVTVGQLYSDTKLSLLRFYLTTREKTDSHSNQRDESETPLSQDFIVPSPPARQPQTLVVEQIQEEVVDLLDYEDLEIETTSVDSDIVLISTGIFSGHTEQSLDDTLPVSPQALQAETDKTNVTILVVHRGQVLRQLIAHFLNEKITDTNIQFQLVLPDGTLEKGFDTGGVVRDCLSEFWSEFYEQCTTGNELRVPFLRHDFGQLEWQSVGRILAFGWKMERYLPVKMAPVIIEQAAFGFTRGNVVENFLKYMPVSDRSLMESWCSDFTSVDEDELIEVLDNCGCRRIPTAQNADAVLKELAHKTVIQEPAYVIEQWMEVLSTTIKSLEDLTTAYETLQPTGRKILKSLYFPDTLNARQKDIQKHLTLYLKNADSQHLCAFLRFCTGSDLFLGKRITISFNQLQGLQRRPVAHTCGCVLELSVHYDSYPDFSSEMNKVLECKVWVMDIV